MIISPPPRESSFASLLVGSVMRRTLLKKPESATLLAAIATFIKYKADAILVVDEAGKPTGVVTKTEVMSGYFGELPIDTALGAVMGAPVISCTPEETLQHALLTMEDRHIHRIFVIDPADSEPLGSLSYPDIVGVLYRYCCRCDSSLRNRRRRTTAEILPPKLIVRDVMHHAVISGSAEASIEEIIGLLASYQIGALLLTDGAGRPAGVLSKTDLTLAYRRGVPLWAKAESIMHRKVMCCRASEELELAIRQMIFAEVSRLFVKADNSDEIVGIVTLTDAARARSGSCRACSNSRIIPKG